MNTMKMVTVVVVLVSRSDYMETLKTDKSFSRMGLKYTSCITSRGYV
jgi:phosphoribosylcarboxyaminoimidazole (NCAIR) mutase